MVIKVIFDDNTDDMIYSHMLQLAIEFGLNGKKIKMFYRESENAWIVTDCTFSRKRSTQMCRYNGPERRNEVALANYHYVGNVEPEHESSRHLNAVNCSDKLSFS